MVKHKVTGTENWRIKAFPQKQNEENFFFIEGDLPDVDKTGHYPRVEVMQEDYGDHNGYTHELRMADARLIVQAPKMLEAIMDSLEVLNGDGVPNINWVKNRLIEGVKEYVIGATFLGVI